MSPQHNLVNHFFNGSLLKQRIIMLQKNKSHHISLLKYGLSAPLFMLMLVLSSATVNNSNIIKKVNYVAQNVFLQPVSPTVILQMPAIIKHANAIDTEQTFSAIKQNDGGKLTSTTSDTIVKNNADSTHNLSFSANKSTGSTVRSYGNLTSSANKSAATLVKYEVNAISQGKPVLVGTIYSDTTQNEVVFNVVEVQPQNPGFGEFLAKNIKYPADAREKKIEGKVIVGFVIQKDGSVNNVRLVHSTDERFDAEALRVVSMSPKWTPGYQNGKAVNVQYTIPVVFSLGIILPDLREQQQAAIPLKKWPILFYGRPTPLYILDGKEIKQDDF